MQYKTLGVVGAGQMGAGIAQVMAQFSDAEHVILIEPVAVQRDKARAGIETSLSKLVEKNVLSEAQKASTLSRLRLEADLSALSAATFVVEAITEHEPTKQSLFQALDGILPESAILASNTSSIPITRLAAVTKRPAKVIGMHFMNPVPLMKLVEIIEGAQTAPETLQATQALAAQLQKTTVVSQDYPGFIANRILMPMLNEAMFAVYEGVGSAEDIDTVMKLGMNHPMGPLTLADFIGLDTCLAILEVLYEGFKDPKYRPCPLLVQKVNAGYFGKKSGRGFFHYSARNV